MKKLYFIVSLCIVAHGYVFAQTWVPQPPAIQNQTSTRYHWADLDGDGDTDVLEYGGYNGVIIYTRTGSSFTGTQSGLPDNFFQLETNFSLNDYDNDGDLDILFTRFNDVAIGVNPGNNSFTATDTNITYNDNEYGPVYWQDVDGDLDLDVVHNRSIYINNNGTYAKSSHVLNFQIRHIVWGDINNDGLVDILGTSGDSEYSGSPLQVFINKGNGNFQSAEIETEIKVGGQTALLLFDADNDGKLDILAMDEIWGRCFVLRNTSASGQIQFATPYSLGIGNNGNIARAGDLNADGLADLVIGGYSNTDNGYRVMVFKNASSGSNLSFSKTNSFESAVYINALHLTDYDADNDLDIHMKVYDQYLGLETNLIQINTATVAGSAPAVPTSLTSTLNTKVNLAWTGQPQYSYTIEFKRNGQAIRINPTTTAGILLLTDNPSLISSPNLTVYNPPAGSYSWRVQSVDKSRRTSAFSASGTFEITPAPTGLTLQILNMTSVKLCWNATANATSFSIFRRLNDAAPEEIASVPANTLCYTDASLQTNSHYEYFVKAVTSGAYSAPSQTATHYSSQFVARSFGTHEPNIVNATCHPADYDLDGDYDLEFMGRILNNYGSDLNFRNDGSGNFPQMISILPALPEYEFNKVVSARDMDNDGDTDFCVILGSDYGRQRVALLVNQNGTLTLGFQTEPYLSLYQAAVADFNNDGRPDIFYRHAVGNSTGNPGVHELLLQQQGGTFTATKFKFSEGDYDALGQFLVADLNNDGFQDICFTGTDYEPLHFFINEEGMTFTKHSPELSAMPLSFLDIDGDGITDYVGSTNDGFRWFKGAANFQYAKQQVLHQSFSTSAANVRLADFNLDGLPDLMIGDDYHSSIDINKGNAVFEMSSAKLDSTWGSSVTLTDLENDGDLDIVKLGYDGQHQGYNYLYLNQAKAFGQVNARPSVPTSLAATFSNGKLNISWQPSTDDKTSAKYLSYSLWVKDSPGNTWLHGATDATGLFTRQLTYGNVGYRTSYMMRDLPAGTYKVRVQAVDASFASSAWSPEITVTIAAGPTNLQVERILLNKIKLTWTGSAFVEQKVIVERKSVESEYEVIAELPSGSATFTDENLPYNKNYQYRVTEVSNAITTASSNVASWSTLMWIVNETTLPNMYGSLDIADYTNDGRIDILINGGRSYDGHNAVTARAAFENTGSGWVQHDVTPSSHSTIASFKFFDINDDHKLDLYQQGYTWTDGYKTEVFLNNGDKTFTPTTNEFTQHGYEIQSRYDVDMDNDLDISVIDRANGEVKKFLRNNGTGYTAEYIQDPDCGAPCSGMVASADFDGDGDEDFIRYENNNFALYFFKPEGHVFSGITFPSYENQIGVFDYNGDGLPDIALLTSSYYTSGKLYQNRGIVDGALKFDMIRSDLPSGESLFNVADFDHDGYLDIALISPEVTMYRNTGQGTFDKYQIPYYKLGGHSGIVDYDNDGDLDVYVMGSIHYQYNSIDEPFARIILNQTIDGGKGVMNTPPATPMSLSAVQDSLGMHLTWSDGIDDHTAATALTHDIILYRDGKAILKAAIDPVTGKRQRVERGRFTDQALITNLRSGDYTWKVQAVDQSYKASELSLAGSFKFLPLPPVAKDTVVYTCGRAVTITAEGTDIRWYSDYAKTNLIATGEFHPEKSQVVYVTQKIGGYEGIPRKVVITIFEAPPPPVTSTSISVCENYNGQLYLSATGNQIRWYGDANKNQLLSTNSYHSVPIANRTYYVTQTLGMCESEPLSVSITITTINSEIYGTNDHLEVGEKNADYYSWYKNGSPVFNSNSASIPYNGETASYTVIITKDGCTEYSRVYNMPFDLVTGIEDDPDADWSVYPNPATGYFTIDVAAMHGVVKIYNTTGKLVYTVTMDNSAGMLNTHEVRIPGGVYLVTFEDGTKLRSKRIVVY